MKFLKKWYTYQKERFPIIAYSTYIFAIVFAIFCVVNFLISNLTVYERIIYFSDSCIHYYMLIPMFVVTFLQFLMSRIIDEFKDYKEDCEFRSYRPVPRGLITLKELGVLFIICAILQFTITFVFCKNAIIWLVDLWILFAIMSCSFFIKKFLDKHLLIESSLDKLLMPFLVVYLAFFPYGSVFTLGLSKYFCILLFISYMNCLIVEVARKIRCKEDEEEGVRTFTKVLGINKAMLLLILLETIVFALDLAMIGEKNIIISIIAFVLASIPNILFMKFKNKRMAKIVGVSAYIYAIIIYLSMSLLLIL